MSASSAVTLAAIALIPLTLGFAGHEPVAGTTSNGVAVNTLLAQADTEADHNASVDPRARGSSAGGDGYRAFNLTTGAGSFALADGDEGIVELEVDEREEGGISDVVVTTVHKDQDGRTAVVVRFERDGKKLEKRIWLDDGDEATLEISGPEEIVPVWLDDRDEATLEISGPEEIVPAGDEFGAASKPANESRRQTELEVQERDDYQIYDERFSDNYGMEDRYMNGATSSGQRRSSASDDILDYAEVPPTERKIAEQLDSPTEAEFIDTPLSDVVEFLAQTHGMPIIIDKRALEDIGVPADEPVNLIMRGVKLESVLNHILRPLGCTMIIRDEILQVTSAEKADEYLVTRVYNIEQLGDIDDQDLARVIETSLTEAHWKTSDGAGGTISAIDGALVVTQTQAGHEQVADLLQQLQRHRQMTQSSRQQASQTDPFGGDSHATAQPAERRTSPESSLTVEMSSKGQIRCAGRAVSERDLVKLIRQRGTTMVELRVSPAVSSAKVSHLIETLQSARVPGLRFKLKAVESANVDEAVPAESSSKTPTPPIWERFSDERLSSLLEDEQPVLVNFTADWCLVCKQNEQQALHTTVTTELLKQHGITALQADYTRPNDEIREWLERFGTKSVPLVAIFPAGEATSPILIDGMLTQESILDQLAKAVDVKTTITN